MISVWIKVRVKPKKRTEFLEAAEIDALGSERDEPGCLRFNVFADSSDEDVYYLHEVYENEAARAWHRTTPHYQVWKAAAHTLDGPAERIECRPVFPADPAIWKTYIEDSN